MSHAHRVRLLIALAVAPAVWAIDLFGSYVLVHLARATRSKLPLAAMTILCSALALGSAVIAWRAYRDAGQTSEEGTAWRIVAAGGVVLCLGFALVIMAQAVPKVLMGVWE